MTQMNSQLPNTQPMNPDITSQRTIESIQDDDNVSYKSIRSINKSDYNRGLLNHYNQNREKMEKNFVQNLDEIDHKNELNVTTTRNDSVFNYMKASPGGNLKNFSSYIKLKSLNPDKQSQYSTVQQINFQENQASHNQPAHKQFYKTVEIPKYIEPKKFEFNANKTPGKKMAETMPAQSSFRKLKKSRSARQIFDDDNDFFSIRSPSNKKKKNPVRKIGRRSYNQGSGILTDFMAHNQHKNSNDLDKIQNMPQIPAFDLQRTLSNSKQK